MTISQPTTGTSTNNNTITISGTSNTNGGSNISHVQYRLTGATTSSWTNASGTTSWSVSNVNFNDGTTTIEVKAINEGGLESNIESVNILVDTLAPTVNITSPSVNETENTSVTISGTASDSGSGVSHVQYRLTGATTLGWTNASGTTNWTAGNVNINLGTTTIEARAYDNVGNVSNIVSRNISRVAPTVWSVSGGSVGTYPGQSGYIYHEFLTNGTLVISSIGQGNLEYAIVGGGGSGGSASSGGGGGGGAVVTGTYSGGTGTFSVVVGNGGSGVGPIDRPRGNSGGQSSIFGVTAAGGGGGGAGDGHFQGTISGGAGGCGGGGGGASFGDLGGFGGSGNPGGNGGNGARRTVSGSNNTAGGGGGGSSSNGFSGQGGSNVSPMTNPRGGDGGSGTQIFGGLVFGSGGGGASSSTIQSDRGLGGDNLGGHGGIGSNPGTNAVASRGAGGGGGSGFNESSPSGAGSDGRVIIRYPA